LKLDMLDFKEILMTEILFYLYVFNMLQTFIFTSLPLLFMLLYELRWLYYVHEQVHMQVLEHLTD